MWHYELLPTDQIMTVDQYSQQMERVKQALKQMGTSLVNHKGVMFLYENPSPHVERVVRDTIWQLGLEIQ